METRKNNTKERILEEALQLFARNGYMGTSMNDIAAKLGVTKAALYKHYTGKQEILDSIVKKMNDMDRERFQTYEMPGGTLEQVIEGYRETAFEKIKEFTKVQFLHWIEEGVPCSFRKMLTLEQYRDPQMANLYQEYISGGPLSYMEKIFSGLFEKQNPQQLALDFYGPIFLLYNIYDGTGDKEKVLELLDQHMEHFSKSILVPDHEKG